MIHSSTHQAPWQGNFHFSPCKRFANDLYGLDRWKYGGNGNIASMSSVITTVPLQSGFLPLYVRAPDTYTKSTGNPFIVRPARSSRLRRN